MNEKSPKTLLLVSALAPPESWQEILQFLES